MKSKFGVIIFPGSNCDHDMLYLFERVLEVEVFPIWHKERDLGSIDLGDGIILPGGFSYGDYLRCGAIARFSPVMRAVVGFAKEGGFVFGICNGFQILCESQLLPGVLLPNTNRKYRCMNVHLRVETEDSMLTTGMAKGDVLKIPIAHADGRYYADAKTYEDLVNRDQILFRYCHSNGVVDENSNPNGTLDHIAGICNSGRNVYGMMPHPERASEAVHGNIDGLRIFHSILRSIQNVKSTSEVI